MTVYCLKCGAKMKDGGSKIQIGECDGCQQNTDETEGWGSDLYSEYDLDADYGGYWDLEVDILGCDSAEYDRGGLDYDDLDSFRENDEYILDMAQATKEAWLNGTLPIPRDEEGEKRMTEIKRCPNCGIDLNKNSVFDTECQKFDLDPENTSLFELECHMYGLDPGIATSFELECRKLGLDPKTTSVAKLKKHQRDTK